MRAVLGILFLLVGFMMAYMVLTGKLPSAAAAPSAVNGGGADFNNAAPSTSAPIVGRASNIGGGPVGIPTMAHLNDTPASHGGVA
jgi:hypothetical protein